MKQITINGRVLGIVDVPEESEDWEIFTIDSKQYLNGMEKDTPNILVQKKSLPPGNWSILGRLNDITEEQAAGIVRIHDPKSYLTATLKLHGIEGNPLILLLNDKV